MYNGNKPLLYTPGIRETSFSLLPLSSENTHYPLTILISPFIIPTNSVILTDSNSIKTVSYFITTQGSNCLTACLFLLFTNTIHTNQSTEVKNKVNQNDDEINPPQGKH